MAGSTFSNVRLTGLACAVPGPAVSVQDGSLFPEAEVAKISASTGVMRRHLADDQICTSDLCAAATERLFAAGSWTRDSIDALIFVTQTPDYRLPATACSLQSRLKLPESCAAFDVNLGCSGYVYGLWLASALLNGGMKRVLLLVGDTGTKLTSPADRSVAMLFGDAGTATLLDYDPSARPAHFELGTDGSGVNHLIVPAGGFRKRADQTTSQRVEREGGNVRSDEDVYMNGSEIFAFTMQRVPQVCRDILRRAEWEAGDVDHFVMHQANRFILQHLSKLMKLSPNKVVVGLEDCGNTSSASIPMAMTARLRDLSGEGNKRLVLVGFGVGFSWGAAAFDCGSLVMPELVICSADAEQPEQGTVPVS